MTSDVVAIEPARNLCGTLSVPGDKSITHRAIFFAALNSGITTISNPSTAQDCDRSLEIIRAIGCDVARSESSITIDGGRRAAGEGVRTLDCGNSGTTSRLALGLLAAEQGLFRLIGDASLSTRPMNRVVDPLRSMGARIETADGHLPAMIEGAALSGGESHGVVTVESAQVHAALVLAALRSRAGASLYVARAMRDHTWRMLGCFGITSSTSGNVHRVTPVHIERDVHIDVPGDVSSASFLITAAVLTPGSSVTIEGVGLNPSRIAFIRALQHMGAQVEVQESASDFEPRGRLVARYSPALRGANFDENAEDAIAEMIDELPLLALVATQASGTTSIRNAEELRVKESDRIATTCSILRALGANAIEHDDGLELHGPVRLRARQRLVAGGDHRIAMMAAIGALIATDGAVVAGADAASISYPSFWSDLNRIGATVQAI